MAFGGMSLGDVHTFMGELRGLCAVTITWNVTIFHKYTAYPFSLLTRRGKSQLTKCDFFALNGC